MKNKDLTINDLGMMVKEGFDGVDKRLNNLEDGQEAIKLRPTNVAYRFESAELQKRVEILENKLAQAS